MFGVNFSVFLVLPPPISQCSPSMHSLPYNQWYMEHCPASEVEHCAAIELDVAANSLESTAHC